MVRKGRRRSKQRQSDKDYTPVRSNNFVIGYTKLALRDLTE